jgi:hypothetical protein
MKKQVKKLALSKETLRHLAVKGLDQVAGGTIFHVSDTCASCKYCVDEPI